MSLKDQLVKEKLPVHVAVIMDGNGRWARKRGNSRVFGHRNGVRAVRAVTEASAELGIGYLTLYAFSTENWNRPKAEVDALMALLVKTISSETKTLMDNNVQLNVIGCRESLPSGVLKQLENCISQTSANTGLVLTLALSYSSRWEILEAIKNIVRDAKTGQVTEEQIDADLFGQYLSTAGIPDPELMIRTSGENRISNFLLWQLAYSELYFSDVLWPDFNKEEFYKALLDFQGRERRFGMISEQIKK
ncbi:undecaprenyl diphosphate synthase [Breznakibacter xylanolyticus]|uniref:Isoprenyl transferase n=1 Tax=Breznakibacter xylanolyticus TaxID=990 RepID=A0A2W7NVM5_9BACT|nr:isoprenyl transferase [Breznakibacter xylanolyticus]MBN2743537.1 isoprenyl transferase [Marinilabiliaceae bacterium]PZX17356.1 undecaprenyl diphosphate synthase [Breznakibacter xylanolyticus]